jgi:hypothetical protein
MKPSELKMLWKLVKSGEERPLSAADLALLLRIRFALQEYEAKIAQQHSQIRGANVTASGPPLWRGDWKSYCLQMKSK